MTAPRAQLLRVFPDAMLLVGCRDLAKLAVAIEHDLARTTVPPLTKEAAILVTA